MLSMEGTHLTEPALTPQQLQAVIDDVQDALFVTDPSGNVIYMNPAASELFDVEEHHGEEKEGINLQEHLLDGYEMRTLEGASVAPDDQPLVRALRGEAYRDVELLVQREGDEHPRVHVFSGNRLEGPPPLGVLTVRDETDRWRAERRYRVAFDTDPAPSVIARLADLCILQANEGMEELTGLDKDALTSRSLTELEPLRKNDDLRDTSERLRTGERVHKLQRILLREHETDVHVLVSARAIEIDGEACGIFTFIDTSELDAARRGRREAQDQLDTTLRQHADEKVTMARLATTDPLTAIANRRGLNTRLSEELSRAERYGSSFCILLLDLDHFKAINDAYGHHVGDLMLRSVAHLLQEECREPDVAGRWGGEEFMMILPQIDITEAQAVASRVRERVASEDAVGMDDLTVSIGVASFEAGDTLDSLFARADRALYAAKERGRNRVEVAAADGAGP